VHFVSQCSTTIVSFQLEAPNGDGQTVPKAAAEDPTPDAEDADEGNTQVNSQTKHIRASDDFDGDEA
jgi:hypothetical protein